MHVLRDNDNQATIVPAYTFKMKHHWRGVEESQALVVLVLVSAIRILATELSFIISFHLLGSCVNFFSRTN